MSKRKTDINPTSNDGQKQLDISVNVSHKGTLSRKNVIRLVKLLARQAAQEDYRRSILHSKIKVETDENAR